MAKDEILVIKGESKYNVLRYASDIIAAEFSSHGNIIKTIDFTSDIETADAKQLTDKLLDKYKFIFSCQAVGFEQCLKNGRPLVSYLQAPYFGWIFDHPIYHKKRLENAVYPHTYIGCIDKAHIDYISKYQSQVSNFAYLPHGGFECNIKRRFSDREIDIFSPGSCSLPAENKEGYKKLTALGDPGKQFKGLSITINEAVSDIVGDMVLYPEKPVHIAVTDYLADVYKSVELKNNYGVISAENQAATELINNLIYMADKRLRQICRMEGIRQLLDSGFMVTVTGSGWQQVKEQYGDRLKVIYENGMDIVENIETIGNSKVCLNLFPSYTQGMHERLLTAMLCRCGCITVKNDYLEQEFTGLESPKFITMKDIRGISDCSEQLLRDRYIEDSLETSYKYVSENHTWAARANEIMRLFE